MLTNQEVEDDDRIVAKCYLELGNVTKEKGEYDESLRYHRKSMEIFERIDDALSVADSHLNIAEVYKAKGELKRAMSEYEKGLTLYEDVYVEDTNKNSDSGTDVSLNSSSFSDLQRIKTLTKSEETLPQTTLMETNENEIPTLSSLHSMHGEMNASTSSLDQLSSSTKKIREGEDVPQLTISADDSFLIPSDKLPSDLLKPLSSSSRSDLRPVIDNHLLLPLSPEDLAYETTVETTSEESDLLEIYAPLLPPLNSSVLDTKSNETDNNNQLNSIDENTVSNNEKQVNNSHRLWYRLPKKQLLIIIISVLLASTLVWTSYSIPIKSLLSCASSDLSVDQNSPLRNPNDLSEQLRKILTWRKYQMKSLSKDSRQIIDEFLTNSDSQRKISVDKFQRLMDMLDLKLVLIPQ